MNRSESIAQLAEALSKAQAEMKPPPMRKKNPFLGNMYSELSDVIDVLRGPFAKYGLCFSQFPYRENGAVGVETLLMHSSGEWLCDRIDLPVSEEKGKSPAQVATSAVTYLRRCALESIAGIRGEEDVDGTQPRNTVATLPGESKADVKPSASPAAPKSAEAKPAAKAGGNGNAKPKSENRRFAAATITAEQRRDAIKVIQRDINDSQAHYEHHPYVKRCRDDGKAFPPNVGNAPSEIVVSIAAHLQKPDDSPDRLTCPVCSGAAYVPPETQNDDGETDAFAPLEA